VTSGSGMDPPSEVCARIGVAPPSPAERSLPSICLSAADGRRSVDGSPGLQGRATPCSAASSLASGGVRTRCVSSDPPVEAGFRTRDMVRAMLCFGKFPPVRGRSRSMSRLPGRSPLPSLTFARVAARGSSRTFDRSAYLHVNDGARDPPDLGAISDAFRSLRPGS